ncbi:MAG: hypothetical protein AAFV07_17555, partial [Bacteroidota bacterium]
TGIGSGNKHAQRLEKEELTPRSVLYFSDETPDTARVIGINSSYIFYVLPEQKVVSISPVGVIQRMDPLPDID